MTDLIESKKKLKAIETAHPQSIRAAIALEALSSSYDDPKMFFFELQEHGCVSGLVSGLIHHKDTHDFFYEHNSEIENLIEDWEDITGDLIEFRDDFITSKTWFAFEYAAYRIAKLDLNM